MRRRVDLRRKKKRRLPSSEGESAGIPAGEQRNWADLPALLLGFIVDRLFLLPDLFAFAGVCNSWRSVFLHSAGKDALTYRPPLLLRPIGTFRGQTQKWKKPAARCQLTNPTSDHPPPAPYLCMISSRTLSSSFCIATSFGNLILVNRRRIIIADVFTGQEIVSPELPPNVQTSYNTSGIFLTAPPSSPDCRLILSDITVHPPLLTWLVGSDVWSRHPLPLLNLIIIADVFTGWGGRSNCIYFAGSETDSWSVHPLGEVFPYDSLSPRSPLFLANEANPFWPIWVYPSMFSK